MFSPNFLATKSKRGFFSQTLEISRELAAALAEPNAGLYLDWGPDSARYLPHIDTAHHLPTPKNSLKHWAYPRKPTIPLWLRGD